MTTAKAIVDWDNYTMGVRIGVRSATGYNLTFNPPDYQKPSEAASIGEVGWLKLPEEEARAMYEALADFFGHASNDVRMLRRDYDAERTRVDKLIEVISDTIPKKR